MFRNRAVRLAATLAVAMIASLSAGHAASNGGDSATPAPEGVYTHFRTALNGVTQTDVKVPGIPGNLPVFARAAAPSIHPCLPCVYPQSASQTYYSFQWWMSVYNSSHSLMYSFSQWYDWSGSDGQVTYFATECMDNGGYWNYKGCSTNQTPTYRKTVRSHGSWSYICCYNNSWGWTNRPSADATVTSDGTISGAVTDG